MENKRRFGFSPIAATNRQALELRTITLGSEIETFAQELVAGEIYITKEKWQRKLDATRGALMSAAAIALEADGVDEENAQLASRSLGVKSITLGMTESEGKATAIIDAAAMEMLKAETALLENHWFKIVNIFHPTSNLGEDNVENVLAGLNDLDLTQIVLSASPTLEDIQMTVDGREILLSKDQCLSLLAKDLYMRARDNRGLWDTKGSETPLSMLANALRKQVHLGLLIQRSDEVLENIKHNQKDNLSPELLALLAAEHFGYHGTGEEKFFVKMPDGSVVEQLRMKECDGCAHGAEETIKNLTPEIEISEIVTKFEARNVEQLPKQPEPETIYYLPPLLGVPLVNRSSVWTNRESSNAQSDASFDVSVAESSKVRKPGAKYWWTQTAPKRREAIAKPTILTPKIYPTKTTDVIRTPNKLWSKRNEGIKPAVQIVKNSTGEKVVVDVTNRRENTVDSEQIANTKPRLRPRTFDARSRRDDAAVKYSPVNLRSLGGRVSPMSRGGKGETPHSRPSNKLDGITRKATSIPKAHTYSIRENKVTGALLKQAIKRVEAQVKVETSDIERSVVEKEVKVKSKTHKPIFVAPVANTIREDGATQVTGSPLPSPTQPAKAKTKRKSVGIKDRLGVGASIALAAPHDKYIDVSNRRSAKEMFMSALRA